VYSKKDGSVVAPTAGLHFYRFLLYILHKKGVHMVFLTLHIGSGTFQPVRCNLVKDHIMHSEYVEVSQDVVNMVKECENRGKRVIAIGTSTLRVLESSCNSDILGDIVPFFLKLIFLFILDIVIMLLMF
jgi:S-adenosylmethionine:tRNA ribosyltransferase-isomerase